MRLKLMCAAFASVLALSACETTGGGGGYGAPRTQLSQCTRNALIGAGVGAVIGGVLGHQIGSGNANKAATAGGAVIGAAIGHQQAVRRSGYTPPPPREYTVQRCDTRYHDEWQERVDGYRVTYQYHGRRQVTEMAYRPGDRIRVRVDVSPAES